MVEAWVTHESSVQDREKNKRRKTQDEPGSSLPVLSDGEGGAGLVTLFQQCVSAWSLITAHSSLETQFSALISQLSETLGPLTMFQNFQVTNFSGRILHPHSAYVEDIQYCFFSQ